MIEIIIIIILIILIIIIIIIIIIIDHTYQIIIHKNTMRPAFQLCRQVSFRFLWLPHQSHHSPALQVARSTSIDILVTC